MNAKVLSSIGIEADWIGRGPGSRELAEGWPKWATGKVLHLTGSAGDGSFVQRLRKKGVQAERLIVYRNTANRPIQRPVQEALRREGADWVVFASGSAAVRFRKVMPKGVGKMKVLAIGPATARTAKSVGWRVKSIATEPSAMGVLRAILKDT
jgi:uroporphyrinogen-III synthase